MDIQKIKELALANGFSLKEQASGNMDLHSYVYEFANAIEQAAKAQANKQFEDFIDQAIEDSACADERRSLQALLDEFQEPPMTENTIRCTNCGLEFESDYDLEQNLIDPETGEIHDGCPTCKTDAYLMDLIKYPDAQEPAND